MNRAHQIVSSLIDEGFTPDYSEPTGRDYELERTQIKTDLDCERRKELEREEREAGLETEREMREQGWSPEEEKIRAGTATSGHHGKRARDYFSHSDRKRWPKMPEVKVGKVSGGDWPTKPTPPPVQIKGRQMYQPAHFAMPAPWKNWR